MIQYIILTLVVIGVAILFAIATSLPRQKSPLLIGTLSLVAAVFLSGGTWYILDQLPETNSPGGDSIATASQSEIEEAAIRNDNESNRIVKENVNIEEKGRAASQQNLDQNRKAVDRFKEL